MINFDSFLLQNPWRSKGFTFSSYINRDMFPSVLPYLSQNHIIIITGARQVGKTTLMYQVMEHLTAEGISPQNIFYFNLDDEELLDSINNPAE
ncbi:MAG: AAA family ATPase [Nitrospirae bacterium]|nr:AAA family ATPase [Nitrospirota bacterium]